MWGGLDFATNRQGLAIQKVANPETGEEDKKEYARAFCYEGKREWSVFSRSRGGNELAGGRGFAAV